MSDDEGTLGSICTAVIDCPHKTAPTASPGHEYAHLVGTPNVKGGRLRLDISKWVDRETYQAWTERGVPVRGDLILTREAPVGEVGIINRDDRICLGQRTVLLRPDPSKVSSRYLLYFLMSPLMQKKIHSRAEGSTVSHLNVDEIRRLQIKSLPSIENQTAVATILGSLDDKISASERLSATSLELGRTLFKACMNDCSEMNLGELIDLAYGKALREPDRRSGDVPVFGCTGRVGWHDLALTDGPGVVIGRKGANAGAVSWSHRSCWVIDTAFFVKLRGSAISQEFALFLLRSIRLEGLVGDSAVPGLNRAAALSLNVSIPCSDVMEKFTHQIRPILALCGQVEMESRNLSELRDVLLPKLMSGEIRVRDAEKIVEDVT